MSRPPINTITITTVSFHDFNSQKFKLSVSNPKSKYVAYLSVLSRISNCQGLGRKNKHDNLKTDRTGARQASALKAYGLRQKVRAQEHKHVHYVYIYIYIPIYIYIYMYLFIIISSSSSSSSSFSFIIIVIIRQKVRPQEPQPDPSPGNREFST